ncbi:fibroblast growth factor-binding protein 1 [Nematolebias whitei]|uniref:fibroblast growth factor-binding protein 1 n=1 Tax=Nematolebias whitei TaxID=451745 RepID=UPI0018998FE8|nr:fibroblast growth factor-binding protein 1 [Nematolebias whitei]
MALLTNIIILLVLACVSHPMILGASPKGHGRRGRGDRGQHKETGQKLGRQSKSVSAFRAVGDWVTRDKSECTWTATGEAVVTLNITCKNRDRSFSCEYAARPSVCPQYASSKELFWAQISRALKKQKNICQDHGGLVRAGVCKRAGREAHFRLGAAPKIKSASSSIPPFTTKAVKSCQPDNRKLAEQLCSHSWSSFCTFLFTMVKDSDC